jgi:uracil-DNA glycosylase
MNIDSLIDRLARTPTPPDAFNQYGLNDDPNNAIRRQNLSTYLQQLVARNPHVILVMEAPGYRGCRLTGVPVTSRKILLGGLPNLGLFGTANGYQNTQDPGFESIKGEQSATIVWEALTALNQTPLIWNTFPFHPHQMGEARTNRKPRKAETSLGAGFLLDMLDLFRIETVVAVGNVAHETLTGLGIDSTRIRHPAQGGKNDFVTGIEAVLR